MRSGTEFRLNGNIIYIGNKDESAITSNAYFTLCNENVQVYTNLTIEFAGRYVFLYRQIYDVIEVNEFEIYSAV